MSKKAANKGFDYTSYLKNERIWLKRPGLNQGTPVPDKIKCDRCKKLKGRMNYSNKRILDLEERISRGQSKTVTCSACLGGQVQELECRMCLKWKGLDDFAKAQRKNPDGAKCNKCMLRQLEAETPQEFGNVGEIEDDDKDAEEPAHKPSEIGSLSHSALQPFPPPFFEQPSKDTGTLIEGLDSVSGDDDNVSVATGHTDVMNTWQNVGPGHPVATTPMTPQRIGRSTASRATASPAGSAAGSFAPAVRSASASNTKKDDTRAREWAKIPAYKQKVTLDKEDEKTLSYADQDDDSDDDDEVEI
ncbi:hypothetical protein K490DRAFT_54669 [Saccharata proteae CBS 121410]|uniref:Stc1 domain-containing protein n=1 Tax=Saccharata proteae CBS 121410 TaxID=1314787 RepID=A0A9P4HW53_9PEZI|nr:hypothetical protein K490DRAFT_54669 [Saccharata proteae CBS 121410]